MAEEINPISPYPSSVDIGTSPVLTGLAQFSDAASKYVESRAIQQQQARDENLLATAQLEIIKNGGKIPDNILQQSYAYQNALKMAYGNYLGSESYKELELNVLRQPQKYFDQNVLNQEFFAIDDKLKPQVEGDWRTKQAYASATVKFYQGLKDSVDRVRVAKAKDQGLELVRNQLKSEMDALLKTRKGNDDIDLSLPSREELGLPDTDIWGLPLPTDEKTSGNAVIPLQPLDATTSSPELTIPFTELGIPTDSNGLPIIDVEAESPTIPTPVVAEKPTPAVERDIPVASRTGGITTIKPSTAKKAIDTGKFERKVYSADGQLQQITLLNEQGMPVVLLGQEWMKRLYEPKQEVTTTVRQTANLGKIPAREEIIYLARQIAKKQSLDESLVLAVIWQESRFNPKVKSKVGAGGLMQLMPKTAQELGVKDRFNPQQNIEGGVKYLKQLLEMFNGNESLALAAYNAGPNAVKKYGGIPPYKETQNYVRVILEKRKEFK